ncbi:MAG: hypothetical protein A7316_04330 [Candidatus Altiarchaeales archaeon WOR_SM1_86-2]|nr:MAG: hypothetical protein A7316_04330 [Candidatus Altiarchaeales archaeon WOR_SM1_86-2]
MAEKIRARDVMIPIKDLEYAEPDEKIARTEIKIIRGGLGSLPVVKDGVVIGMITQRSISLASRLHGVGDMKVSDLMTKDLICVESQTPLREVIEILLKNRIERIPVVEEKKMVGLITQRKILGAFLDIIS